MQVNTLRELFSRNKESNGNGFGTVSDIVEIGSHVRIENKINPKTFDYYLEINIKELSNSDIDEEIIYNMVDNGWFLSKDKMSIIKIS